MNFKLQGLRKLVSLAVCSFFVSITHSQVTLSVFVKDSAEKSLLPGVTVLNVESGISRATNKQGVAIFKVAAASIQHFNLSSVNLQSKAVEIAPGQADTSIIILLAEQEHALDEVIVSSSRTNSRMEDLPTKVEVLGAEEVAEENGIKPGNIASLLGDIAGIQIQQTSAATGNADLRIQGVPGKYTQLLRDGMPLFGGYGGSFSILQIPPLDLQQIELIKGASSTLYGGGAIAGMVNLISKKPVKGSPSQTFTINRSTLKENNLNSFFSGRNNKMGYTIFAGGNLQEAVDVNKDGFSDVPSVKSFFIHPRLFLYHSAKASTIIGYTINYENRKGGDMSAIDKNDLHSFFIQNKSLRNTLDAIYENKLSANEVLTLKGSSSLLNRNISTNVFGMKANQLSWYSEAAYAKKTERITLVTGLNLNGETFTKSQPDSSTLTNYSNYTIGAFAQADYKIANLTLQPGVRADYVQYHLYKKVLLLPRISLMYKFDSHFTSRIGGGFGYKIPTPFSAEVDERSYHLLLPTNTNKPERSNGLNADINYKTKAGGWNVTINQGFFLTRIRHPLVLVNNAAPLNSFYVNETSPIVSRGAESYVQLKKDELELYLGYTFTDARRKYDAANKRLPLTARHKLSSVIAYEFSEHFRAGIESSFTGNQYLDNGQSTPSYLFMALMFRYNVGKISFVLNGENLLDYRQSRKELVVYPPYNNPSFPEIWAPLDGRVINLSMTIKLR